MKFITFLKVFDMTRLRGVNTFISHLEPDVHYYMVGASHNIVANEDTGYVYIVGARAGPGYHDCRGRLYLDCRTWSLI